jgi:hypothetical protein
MPEIHVRDKQCTIYDDLAVELCPEGDAKRFFIYKGILFCFVLFYFVFVLRLFFVLFCCFIASFCCCFVVTVCVVACYGSTCFVMFVMFCCVVIFCYFFLIQYQCFLREKETSNSVFHSGFWACTAIFSIVIFSLPTFLLNLGHNYYCFCGCLFVENSFW